MGIDLRGVKDSFLEKLFPEDRKAAKIQTYSEAELKAIYRKEKWMHDQYAQDCNRRGIPYIHPSMARPSTIAVGHPDYTLLRRTLSIEFKVPGCRLSPEQQKRIKYLEAAQNTVVVAHSLEEAIEATKEYFGLV